jgi:hypothetical protein
MILNQLMEADQDPLVEEVEMIADQQEKAILLQMEQTSKVLPKMVKLALKMQQTMDATVEEKAEAVKAAVAVREEAHLQGNVVGLEKDPTHKEAVRREVQLMWYPPKVVVAYYREIDKDHPAILRTSLPAAVVDKAPAGVNQEAEAQAGVKVDDLKCLELEELVIAAVVQVALVDVVDLEERDAEVAKAVRERKVKKAINPRE